MTIKYTDEQISNLLKEVEVAFGESLKKSEEAPVEEDKKEDEGSEEDKKEDAAEDKAEDAQEDAQEDKAEDKKDEPAEEKEEPKDEQDFDYDDDDMEEMHKMYASMHPKEKEAHHNALKKALGLEDKSVEAKPAESVAQPVEMQKSEELAKTEELHKAEITALQTKNAELQKSLDAVSKFLETLNKQVPQRKSITSIDYIQKSEESKEISSEQVDSILQKKVRDSSLSKSDRDAINTYYLNGKSIETIKHLLK